MTDKFVPAEAVAAREAALRAEISHLRTYNVTLLEAVSEIKVSSCQDYNVRKILEILGHEINLLRDQDSRLVRASDDPYLTLDISDLLFAEPAHVYLAELAEKLMRVPAMYGVDQGDVSQVAEIAERIRSAQEIMQ